MQSSLLRQPDGTGPTGMVMSDITRVGMEVEWRGEAIHRQLRSDRSARDYAPSRL